MDLARTVLPMDIEPPRAQVLRLLGIKAGGRPPRASLQRVIDEELAAARELMAPRVVLSGRRGLPGSLHFDPELPLALAVCTVGPALDARIDKHGKAGEAARAMVLDAVGSAAVEELADRSNGRICEQALGAGLRPDVRRSPGYGRWAIEEQRLIFDELEPGEIGVTLTERCLMTPSKSISYAVPLLGGDPGRRARGRCERCGFEDCSYRVHKGDVAP